jgi:hypothetical protein
LARLPSFFLFRVCNPKKLLVFEAFTTAAYLSRSSVLANILLTGANATSGVPGFLNCSPTFFFRL